MKQKLSNKQGNTIKSWVSENVWLNCQGISSESFAIQFVKNK